MTIDFFDNVVKERTEKIIQILSEKAKEYRRNDNPMHNFDKASAITGMSRERALFGFALKHLISFQDILDDLDKGIIPDYSKVDEKIGDLINYFILCEASLKENSFNKKSNE